MIILRAKSQQAGYTLLELLVVMAVIALLATAGMPALSALNSSGAANQNISQLSGILEQARQYAVAQNTYVWVAFYTPTPTNGIKQVSVAVIASTDGTDPGVLTTTTSYPVPATGLNLISKIVTLKQISLPVANTFNHSNLQNLPVNPTVADPANSLASNAGTGFFSIQLPGDSSPVAFSQAIEFTPSGQARNSSSPVNLIDVDMQPQKGNVDDTKNVAVIRVNGLTGQTAIYRP